MSDLIPYDSLNSLYAYAAPSGSSDPLWRLAVTQGADDPRCPDHRRGFFLTRKVRKEVRPGEFERVAEVIKLGADSLRVWPVGFAMQRQLFPPYQPGNPNVEVLCQSEGGLEPYARFAGKYSEQCVKIEAGRVIPVCPKAKWAETETGKPVPPPCKEVHVTAVLVPLQQPLSDGSSAVLAEAYFKSASAPSGKALNAQLFRLVAQRKLIYQHPVDLTVKFLNPGYVYEAVLRTDVRQEFNDDDKSAFEDAIQRWQNACAVRKERAQEPPDGGDEQASTSQRDILV